MGCPENLVKQLQLLYKTSLLVYATTANPLLQQPTRCNNSQPAATAAYPLHQQPTRCNSSPPAIISSIKGNTYTFWKVGLFFYNKVMHELQQIIAAFPITLLLETLKLNKQTQLHKCNNQINYIYTTILDYLPQPSSNQT